MLDDLHTIRILTTKLDDPRGYGRIVTDEKGIFQRIVEEKDATDLQRAIQYINGGIYAVKCGILCRYLPRIRNHNEQREYYLTDIVEIIQQNEGMEVEMMELDKSGQREILGVNTLEDLERLNQLYQPFHSR
jgi:bifunctional UDP-N-acetylglucosamine pyrophosphorylase/glucosamine-1-phosphate N-acetyltransferase